MTEQNRKITVTRALRELKLLDKKIEQHTNKLEIAGFAPPKQDSEVNETFKKRCQANYQQLCDWIRVRARLKEAIVLSNANTKVEVAGESMSVASAIERKQSIELDKRMHERMRGQYYATKRHIDSKNASVADEAETHVQRMLSNSESDDKTEQYKEMVKAYVDNHELKTIAIDDVEDTITKLQDSIDQFESEVDIVLTESNTRTEIEVSLGATPEKDGD